MSGRRVLQSVFLLLFVVAMGARVWLQRRESEARERQMRSLMEATAQFNRENDARLMRKFHEQERQEMDRQMARLEEMRRSIQVPPPLDLHASRPPGPPAPERRYPANEMPHELVVAAAYIAEATMHQAPARDFTDRAARQEIEATLAAVHAELKAALAGRKSFSDLHRVAANLPRVEQALARVEATMKEGTYRKMAVKNIGDLRDDLRDFAAPPSAPDGGH